MAQSSPNRGQRQKVHFDVVQLLWEHCRHMENMRLWFTNIYGIMIVGILIYGSQAECPINTAFAVTGAVLSLLGLFVAVRFHLEHEKYVENIKNAISAIDSDLLEFFKGIIPTPSLWGKWRGLKIVPTSEWLRLRIVFILFYLVMLGVSGFLLAQ